MKHHKNITLELLKLFASYMVVFIHVSFPGQIGFYINALARFAVPFFFLISGFYSYEITVTQIRKRIAHILTLLVCAVILHTCWAALSFAVNHDVPGLSEYFTQYLHLQNLRNLFLLNVPIHSDHLWYLFAALYVYILFYFATLYNFPQKYVFAISQILLVAHLLLNEGLSLFGIFIPNHFLRNFLFMGIPFFGTGLLIRRNQHQFTATPNIAIFLFAAVGITTTLLSCSRLGTKDLYIGSVFLLVAPVLLFIKYANRAYPPLIESLTGCSTGVYILHRIMSSILGKGYALFGVYAPFPFAMRIIHPLLTCFVSTLASLCFMKLSLRINARNRCIQKNTPN